MRVLFDLNVVLDVVQKRQPHHAASATAMEVVVAGKLHGLLPAHAVTTLAYVVGRHQTRAVARSAIAWLLRHFDIAAVDSKTLQAAHALAWSDFEDAVVASAALQSRCSIILTRNIRDFRQSPVPALTPEEFLAATPLAPGLGS